MSPLVIKALINFSKEGSSFSHYRDASRKLMSSVYAANHYGSPQPNISRGVGMALGLWGLTIMQSICQHQVTICLTGKNDANATSSSSSDPWRWAFSPEQRLSPQYTSDLFRFLSARELSIPMASLSTTYPAM